MKENIIEFYELLKLCNQLFYEEYKEPNKYFYEFKNYLSDTIEIKEKLLELLKRNGEQTFFCAPTGSGKTFEIIEEIFKSSDKDTLDILCVPNRSQALQIEKEYGITALVGKSTIDDKENLSKIKYYIDNQKQVKLIENIHVCVYDKSSDIIEFINILNKFKNNLKINFVIDESHSLASAKFRDGALRQLRTLIDIILQQNGSVLYTTASADLMVWGKFDNVIFCDYKYPTDKFQNIKVYLNKNTDMKYLQFVENVLNQEKKGIIRLNDKKQQTELKTQLQNKGYSAETLTSDDKTYDIDENGNIRYHNNVLDSVINHSVLPPVDFTICTSMFDVGQNIVGIGSNDNKPKDFKTFFAINNYQNLNLENIQQLANRVRFPYQTFGIIYCNKNTNLSSEKNFKNKKTLIKNIFFQFQKQIKWIQYGINTLQEINKDEQNCEEIVKNNIQSLLNFKDITYEKDNSFGGAITYEHGKLCIIWSYLLQYIMTVYYRQLYSHFPQFTKELEKIFNKKVEICEYDFDIKDSTHVDTMFTKEKFLKLIENKDFIKNYNDDKYISIHKEKLFKESMEFVILGEKIETAIQQVCTYSQHELNKLRSKLIHKKIKKYLTKNEKQLLVDIICNKKELSDIKNPETYDTIDRIMKNQKYIKKLKSGLEIGIDLDTMLNVIENANNNKEIKHFLDEFQVKENNKNYLYSKSLLMSSSCRIQLHILDYVIKCGFNTNSNNNHIEMSQKRTNELLEIIKEEEKVNITQKKLEYLLSLIFKTWNITKQKQTVLRLIKLNL